MDGMAETAVKLVLQCSAVALPEHLDSQGVQAPLLRHACAHVDGHVGPGEPYCVAVHLIYATA
eukprot:2871110-Pyramimonas_sp.AAC.1